MNEIITDIDHLKKGEVSLGTSIIAVKYKDGVILGADSRTSSGSFVANRFSDKITQIHDKIFCCRSGSSADTQAVSDIVKYYINMYNSQMMFETEPTTEVVANVFQEICYSNKNMLLAGIICAGYDKENKGSVYSIPIGGSIHKHDYVMSGSGSVFVKGWCNEHFKPNMEKNECIDFIKTALTEAIKWDGSSGGVIRMVVLNQDDVERLIFYL